MEKTRRFCSAKTKQFYGGMEKFSNAGNLITVRKQLKNIIKKGTQSKNQEKKQDLSLHTVPSINFNRGRISKLKNYTINDQFLPPPAIVALISESSSSSPRIAS